jgi:hypothetical protein
MAGLVPAIHVFIALPLCKDVDARAGKFTQPAQGLAASAGMTTEGSARDLNLML